jgi:hypothetical protein
MVHGFSFQRHHSTSRVPTTMPETHPLIETVTRPLAKNAKQHAAAIAMLEECRVAGHPAEAETLARLDAVGTRRFAGLWQIVCWMLAILALCGALYTLLSTLKFAADWGDLPLFKSAQQRLPAGLTEKERLLLGDPSVDELEQKRRLHLSDPNNPAYYAEYAQIWARERGDLPPDYLETVQRIAPDNAYFLYYAAAQIGRRSIERKRSSGIIQKPRMVDDVRLLPIPREAEYEIIDRAAYEAALKCFAKAATMPVFETYTNEMTISRIRLFPGINITEMDQVLTDGYTRVSGFIALRMAADVICARAEELSKTGNQEEFIQLAAKRDAFLMGLALNPDLNLVGELIREVMAASTATNFHAAAERLELTDLAEKYRNQADALQKDNDRQKILSAKEQDMLCDSRASLLIGDWPRIYHRYVASPPPIKESDHKPMRMAEHEFVAGLGVLTVAKLMLVSGLALFLFRFLLPRRIRIPARRMARVPGVADWAWVLLSGVVLPILLFLLITRFTPLGGRSHGFAHFMFAFPGVHLVALWLALLIAPVAIMRWRLERRLAPLGFSNRKRWFSKTTLALLLVVSLAAYPLLLRFNLNAWMLGILALPVALATLRLIAHVWQGVFRKPSVRMFKTATGIAALPAYAVAIVLLCLTLPIHLAAERHWVAKDTLFRIDPDAVDLGAYEFKVAAQKRRELNAIMGY